MLTKPATRGAAALAHAVQDLYREGQDDYSLEPVIIVDEGGKPLGRIRDGDAVVFCCRRGEREVQLTEAFTDPIFAHFPRQTLNNLNFTILTLYSDKFTRLPVAFAPNNVRDTLADAISRAGLRQAHIAESEKFAHVTFFLNGGNSGPFPGEQDFRVPSPQGVPYDQIPELSLPGVVDQVKHGLAEGFDFIVANFANGDVIGHTSNDHAKIACAAAIDKWLGDTIDAAMAAGYVVLVTADHGNLELMHNPDGTAHVAHTTNPVPFVVVDPLSREVECARDGTLADVAPTVLAALGINPLRTMDINTLVPRHKWRGPRRVLLLILDGWGIGLADNTNPIHLAATPNWDALLREHAYSQLQAASEAVGLEPGRPGNSEAGHMNIGAGRVITQDDVRLQRAMSDGSFESNEVLLAAIRCAMQRQQALHLIGLLSEKSSHGSIQYPLAILRMAKRERMEDVFLHIIFDGRSTGPGSTPELLQKLEREIDSIGIGQIVSGMGRGIALDRDGDYNKTRIAFEALVRGSGRKVKIG